MVVSVLNASLGAGDLAHAASLVMTSRQIQQVSKASDRPLSSHEALARLWNSLHQNRFMQSPHG